MFFFFFNDPATTEIYTLSLHAALPIFTGRARLAAEAGRVGGIAERQRIGVQDLLHVERREGDLRRPRQVEAVLGDLVDVRDRKSTRLNSSHLVISYAVFCLKKKNAVAP